VADDDKSHVMNNCDEDVLSDLDDTRCDGKEPRIGLSHHIHDHTVTSPKLFKM